MSDTVFKIGKPATFTVLTFQCPNIKWYSRLWAVLKLPYDLVRFVVTGSCYIGHFRNPPQ